MNPVIWLAKSNTTLNKTFLVNVPILKHLEKTRKPLVSRRFQGILYNNIGQK